MPDNLPWEEMRAGLVASGFRRLLIDHEVREIEEVDAAPASLTVVADRLVVRAEQKKRITDSLEQAFHFGKGRLTLVFPDQDHARRAAQRAPRVRALPHRLPRADRQPVLVQQPARRLRDLPRLRPRHRRRPRPGDPRSAQDARRRRHQAVEHAVDRVGARGAAALLPPQAHPDGSPVRAARRGAAARHHRRRGQVLRHPRLVPLARRAAPTRCTCASSSPATAATSSAPPAKAAA